MDNAGSRDVLGLILREPLLPRRDIAKASQTCRLWRDVTAQLRDVFRQDHLWWNTPIVKKQVYITTGQSASRRVRSPQDVDLTLTHIQRAGVEPPFRVIHSGHLTEVLRRILDANMDVILSTAEQSAAEAIGAADGAMPTAHATGRLGRPCHPYDVTVHFVEDRSYGMFKFVLTPCGFATTILYDPRDSCGPPIPRVNDIPEMIMFPNVPLLSWKDNYLSHSYHLILFRGEVRDIIIRNTKRQMAEFMARPTPYKMLKFSLWWRGRRTRIRVEAYNLLGLIQGTVNIDTLTYSCRIG